MRKIVAIAGRPGTGKTTLIRKFMENRVWERVEPLQLVSALYCKEENLYIIGKYEEGEVFAGTDRLSMACQPNIQEWVKSVPANVIFEGDRLTNGKFYEFLINLPDADVSFVVIHAPEITLKQRYEIRGSNQSDTFLKGRETKIGNILTNFDFMSYVTEFENKNFDDQELILRHIEIFLE